MLILGETGTGKEMFARACHAASLRAQKPFLALNCASLPEDLAESELFGYEGGAFTSASRGGKPGLFELADGGTVFLDEIGELTPYLQAKLLRFLQDGSFMRIGGKAERKVDVRIIAATNRDLARMVDAGEFRSDLLFRINVLSIQTPALRDRCEDIPELAEAFVTRSVARTGRSPVRLTAAALTRLQVARWPGNVRELENVIFRSVSLSDSATIGADDLIFDAGEIAGRMLGSDQSPAPVNYEAAFREFEARYFKQLATSGLPSRKLTQPSGLSHATIARKIARYCR